MRACFLGQNVFALGYGVAIMQTQPLKPDEEDERRKREAAPDKAGDRPVTHIPLLAAE